jgi:hypothetical protein
MKMFQKLLLMSGALLCFNTLSAEIQQLTIKWQQNICTASCGKNLEKEFRKAYGVADVTVDTNQAQANIKWKPNIPFSFQPINYSMHGIGLGIDGIYMKATGTIQHTKTPFSEFQLISSGDNTVFHLVSPIPTSTYGYVERYSTFNRGITSELRSQLLDAVDKQQTVTIDGPIFLPYRSPPLQLVVQHFKAEPPQQ